MRTLFFAIISIIIGLPLISCEKGKEQAEWESLNLNYTGDLSDICVFSSDTIMILSKLDKTFKKTCIFESDNAGKTWSQKCFNKLEIGGFGNFYCFNHKKIFAGNYRSYDSGNSWQKSSGNFQGAPMYFLNDEVGVAVVGSTIYRTIDGGISGELVFDSISYAGFNFIQFLNNQVGYAAGGTTFDSYNSGMFAKTTDGGVTWQLLPGKFQCILGMSFITADIGYIVINLHEGNILETYKDGAELLKTTDGGNTWTSVNAKIYEEYNDIPFQCYFVDELHGFLCGSKILSTSDGGNTWRQEYVIPSSDYALNKMIFTSSGTGYVVGNNGLLLKRTIY